MLSFNLSFEITYSFDKTSRMKFQKSLPPTLNLEANSSKELASSDLRFMIYSNLYYSFMFFKMFVKSRTI
jgi:hypothetical protein